MDYVCTMSAVDSSIRFPFRARTHAIADAADPAWVRGRAQVCVRSVIHLARPVITCSAAQPDGGS